MYEAAAAARRLLKLTFELGHLCECLWMNPWVGRFFLFPNSKIPCSVDNWGMGAVFPEEPRRCFLKRKSSRCIHTGITVPQLQLGDRGHDKYDWGGSSNISCFCSRFQERRLQSLSSKRKHTPSLMTSRILIIYTSVDRSATNCSTLTLYTGDRQHMLEAQLFFLLHPFSTKECKLLTVIYLVGGSGLAGLFCTLVVADFTLLLQTAIFWKKMEKV